MDIGMSGISGSLPALDLSKLQGPGAPRGPEVDPSRLAGGQGAPEAGRAPQFGRILNQFIDSVNETQKTAEAETRKVLMGQTSNLHQAMLAGEESGIALRLMVEVRNKLVEGFQEVMRMQV